MEQQPNLKYSQSQIEEIVEVFLGRNSLNEEKEYVFKLKLDENGNIIGEKIEKSK